MIHQIFIMLNTLAVFHMSLLIFYDSLFEVAQYVSVFLIVVHVCSNRTNKSPYSAAIHISFP